MTEGLKILGAGLVLLAWCTFWIVLAQDGGAAWEATGIPGYWTETGESDWPECDPSLLVTDQITLAIQVSGKMRGKVTLERGASEEQALAAARSEARVAAHLDGKTLRRVIYVPDKLLNLVMS